jgi:mRNA-degrading endonuclease toxin of MazEF toxin-antitoxin module
MATQMNDEYTRVTKGMVFIYDIDEDKDKKQFNTTKYNRPDCTEYGRRPWVVVSDNKSIDKICTIAPMSTGQYGKGDKIKTHVDLTLNGTNTCIMLEQMRFVNTHELKEYVTILGNSTMRLVDEAMAFHLGLNLYRPNKVVSLSASKKAFDVINEKSSVEIKEETKVDTKKSETRGRRTKYDKDSLKEILSDYKTMSEKDFSDKYNCKNHQAYLYKGYYIKKLYKTNFK